MPLQLNADSILRQDDDIRRASDPPSSLGDTLHQSDSAPITVSFSVPSAHPNPPNDRPPSPPSRIERPRVPGGADSGSSHSPRSSRPSLKSAFLRPDLRASRPHLLIAKTFGVNVKPDTASPSPSPATATAAAPIPLVGGRSDPTMQATPNKDEVPPQAPKANTLQTLPIAPAPATAAVLAPNPVSAPLSASGAAAPTLTMTTAPPQQAAVSPSREEHDKASLEAPVLASAGLRISPTSAASPTSALRSSPTTGLHSSPTKTDGAAPPKADVADAALLSQRASWVNLLRATAKRKQQQSQQAAAGEERQPVTPSKPILIDNEKKARFSASFQHLLVREGAENGVVGQERGILWRLCFLLSCSRSQRRRSSVGVKHRVQFYEEATLCLFAPQSPPRAIRQVRPLVFSIPYALFVIARPLRLSPFLAPWYQWAFASGVVLIPDLAALSLSLSL